MPRALAGGFGAVHALPLRLREQTVGALNLFTTAARELPVGDARAAQGLADIATISILQDRRARDQSTVTSQLQHALHSRVIIEQAKGVIAERAGVDMSDAFERLLAARPAAPGDASPTSPPTSSRAGSIFPGSRVRVRCRRPRRPTAGSSGG